MDRWSTSASVALAERVSPLTHNELISQTHPNPCGGHPTNPMKRIILCLVLLINSSVFAAEVPASRASIQELLEITNSRSLVDGMFGQIETMMKTSMHQALGGKVLSAEERKISEAMTKKVMTMMKEELAWEKLEPMYFEIYEKSFSQEEVDGMIAFYRSPAGVALVKKMPVVMQETMVAMQQFMGPMMERMQKIVEETVAEIEAEKAE
jgi:hypothetical protein